MRHPVHLLRGVTFLVLLLIPRMALALPAFQMVSDSDDDATVTLGVLAQAIFGDAVSGCELRIEVTSAQEPFTSGDSISV